MVRQLLFRWDGRKLALVLGASAFLFCLWGFLELAEDVPEGQYQRLDEKILRALRDPIDPARPRGPRWMQDAMRDVSALGGPTVLSLVLLGVTTYLLLEGRALRAGVVIFSCGAGAVLNSGLKLLAARPRPEVVPHLTAAMSSSFPSGHSMISALVYLTLGILLARDVASKRVRVYFIIAAGGLTFLVGISRVYLGVHYPTDVVAGWTAGVAWALLCVALELGLLRWWRPPQNRSTRG